MRVEAPRGYIDNLGARRLPRNRVEQFIDIATTPWWELKADADSAILDFGRGLVEREIFRRSAVASGEGIERGNGEPVDLFGGFISRSGHYSEPTAAIKAAGYDARSYNYRTVYNIEPLDVLADQCIDYLEERADKSGRRGKEIGHSKGGLLLAATYAKYPDRFEEVVEQVIFIGSPIPNWINRSIATPHLISQILLRGDDMRLADRAHEIQRLSRRDKVRINSIGTKDPIIKGEHIGFDSDHFEVNSSHTALCHNGDSVVVIGKLLAS